MGWLNRDAPVPKAAEPEYSLEKVGTLLDQVGQMRLSVAAPKLKVLLSLIAQNGEAYLARKGPTGVTSESDIMQFQEDLRAVVRVLEQYVAIQNNPSHPDREAKLREGFDAIDGFATHVLDNATPGGSQNMTDFTVDTKILSAQRFRNS